MLDGYKIVETIYDIPVGEIFVDSQFNCRGFFTAESVQDLASSIRDNGLVEPIVIQPIEDMSSAQQLKFKMGLQQLESVVALRTQGEVPNTVGGPYRWRLVAGHRRLSAITLFLQWDVIPARVIQGLTTEQAQILNFIENLERQDLNIVQEAQAIDRVWPDMAERPLGAILKRNPRWIRLRRRLIKMAPEIQQAAASGRLRHQDIEFIGRSDDPAEQHRLFQGILDTKAKKRKDGPRHKGVEWNAGKLNTRTKPDMGSMMTRLMEAGAASLEDVESLTSLLAWAMRGISTEELLTRLDLPTEDLSDD
jgi:ParB-like chromosome segregation protein Spo0J